DQEFLADRIPRQKPLKRHFLRPFIPRDCYRVAPFGSGFEGSAATSDDWFRRATGWGLGFCGSRIKNVAPFFLSDSTQIFPPFKSMIFFTMGSPTPVPSTFTSCKRWKIAKILS